MSPLFPDKKIKRMPNRDKYYNKPLIWFHPGGALKIIIPEKIEIDFTDDEITSSGGSVFLSIMANHFDLPDLLKENVRIKARKRGASDSDRLLSLIYSLARGDGALCDVDRLGADHVRSNLLGLSSVPKSRRVSDYLARFDENAVEKLKSVARNMVAGLLPPVIEHEKSRLDYVPVFVDGSAIEVYGNKMEGAKIGYSGDQQYWLHGVYIARLWGPVAVSFQAGWSLRSSPREQAEKYRIKPNSRIGTN